MPGSGEESTDLGQVSICEVCHAIIEKWRFATKVQQTRHTDIFLVCTSLSQLRERIEHDLPQLTGIVYTLQNISQAGVAASGASSETYWLLVRETDQLVVQLEQIFKQFKAHAQRFAQLDFPNPTVRIFAQNYTGFLSNYFQDKYFSYKQLKTVYTQITS
eukprot:TRINITY_DN7673_c0_g1_i2.p1 TRINITY_DN7673_c0_g1~~TRINITY_DN7673_c0_g1_i2.p1  ORF type:complete len:160 (-),score=33.07 TRINITY_DN7673_c0_g1_i2:100-579(-)